MIWCFGSKHKEQATVPPHGHLIYSCRLSILGEGPVEAYTELYLEDADGIRTVPLTVKGVGVLPRKPTNEAAHP